MFKLAIAIHLPLALCFAAAPVIDNDRVRIWDVKGAWPSAQNPEFDFVTVYVTEGAKSGPRVLARKAGDPVFQRMDATNPRAIVIELKNHPVPPIKNSSGLPDAFPRPGAKKLLENDRYTVWDYIWLEGKPTPMHFHARDAIVTYLETGSIKSTTQDGKNVVSDYKPGMVKFNARDRIHTEELAGGQAHAIIVELK
jgi:hypothetical protein